MGLDLYPSPYPCKGKRPSLLSSKRKEVRDEDAECWFKDGDHPTNLLEAYCWFKGELLVRELEAIGENKMAKRCFSDLSARKAGKFGRHLLELAGKLRERYRGTPFEKPCFSERVSFYDEKSGQWTLRPYTTTLERVVEILEKGGRWYRKASSLGSGVAAWH
jgi:hypothetical protein